MSEAKQLQRPVVTLGCDPELFLAKGGHVIGAEKEIPKDGLRTNRRDSYGSIISSKAGVVLDGVQVELNPNPSTCRQSLAAEIALNFRTLRDHLNKKKDGVSVSFAAVVTVSKKELDSLSNKAKILGCAPSKNVYDKDASIKVNAATYRKRSAGGHIHMGSEFLKKYPEELIELMDILVGNTCVMIDRDPEAPERRKVYGRAGEFRTPPHGVEYRTLSNFWLRAPELLSLVMGLSRMATSVLYTEKEKSLGSYGWPAITELKKRVNLKACRKAINTNDLDLASENFGAVESFLKDYKIVPANMAITADNTHVFRHFAKRVEKHGMDYWFPKDPFATWCDTGMLKVAPGWESFMMFNVQPDMSK